MPAANQQLKTLTPAQYAFVSWVYKNHPNIAAEAESRREQISGFMDSFNSVFENIVSKTPELLNQYVAGKEKIELLKINLQRAKANEYPLDGAGGIYTGGAGPLAQTMGAPVLGVPTWAWLAGGGLLLYLLLRNR